MKSPTEKPEALIFDLDGTLFQTETLSLPAYHAAFDQLKSEGLYSGPTPPDERFLGSLGLLLHDIWMRVMPDATDAARDRMNDLLLYHQMEGLKQGQGEMYPGVEETLKELHHRGYRLFVASNGLEDYVKGVILHKGLGPLFTALYSAGEYQTDTKVDLVKHLLTTFEVKSAWMCGDRSSDVQAGVGNGLLVVGCNYGGFQEGDELRDANIVIHSFPELLDHLG